MASDGIRRVCSVMDIAALWRNQKDQPGGSTMSIRTGFAFAAALMLVAGPAQAQAPGAQTATPPAFQSAAPPPPAPEYGMSIGVAEAKRAAAAAVAESGKIGANPMAVAIVDTGGHLVYF